MLEEDAAKVINVTLKCTSHFHPVFQSLFLEISKMLKECLVLYMSSKSSVKKHEKRKLWEDY